MSTRELENGWKIHELNKHETDFLYNEIVIEDTYSKNEFDLESDGVILDIGANIGLFSLYMHNKLPQARIICFEPSKICVELARRNTAHCNTKVEILEIAAGNENKSVDFIHYPGYSIMSGILADESEDKETLIAGAKSQAAKRGINLSERELELLADSVLGNTETYTCQMRRISDVLSEMKISNVSLLKIDVEKAELMVLEGLEQKDLEKINNVIVEVHDMGNAEHKQVEARLAGAGFNVSMVSEKHLENSNIYTVWGWRK